MHHILYVEGGKEEEKLNSNYIENVYYIEWLVQFLNFMAGADEIFV